MPARSIRARVLAAFVLSLAAMAGALGYGLVQLRDVGADVAMLNRGYLPLAEVAAELEAVVGQLDRDHDRLARESPRPLAGHRKNAEFYVRAIRISVGHGREVLQTAAPLAREPRDETALDAASSALTTIDEDAAGYEDAVGSWMAAESSERGVTDRALAELDRARQDIATMSDRLSALVAGRIEEVGARAASALRRALLV